MQLLNSMDNVAYIRESSLQAGKGWPPLLYNLNTSSTVASAYGAFHTVDLLAQYGFIFKLWNQAKGRRKGHQMICGGNL